jgi:hypothetical protein
MLRRKLLLRIGVLVALYIVGAVGAIALLQGVIGELDSAASSSAVSAETIDRLEASFVAARETLEDEALNDDASRTAILGSGERARAAYAEVGGLPVASDAGASCYARIGTMLDGIAPKPEWLEGQGLVSWRQNAPGFADELMAEIAHLRQLNRAAAGGRQLDITRELRNLIIGLTVAALVMLNVTIVLLLNTGEMIVRPVEALVEHSRALAEERFDSRVETPGGGEFGALAESYNSLAAQLLKNEQRKMETLQQLGVSLNHELNNVINIIELQLASLDRHAKGDGTQERKLVQIRENLHRIAETVASLKDVRRIVVTEYANGTLMLDLPGCTRSLGPDEPAEHGSVANREERGNPGGEPSDHPTSPAGPTHDPGSGAETP